MPSSFRVHMNERTLPLPPELGRLSTFIDSHTECLARPSSELRSIALLAAKHIFDWALKTETLSKPHIEILLATLTGAAPPQTRSQASRGSMTKKSQRKVDIRGTPLPSLFIEDMNIDQIWQQLDLRAARICENLQTLLGDDEEGRNAILSEDSDSDASEDEDEDEEDDEEMSMDEDETVWEALSDGEENRSSTAEAVSLRDETEELEEDDDDNASPTSMLDAVRGQKPNPSAPFSQRHSDLDDGFFDLATFNAETSELEGKKVYKRNLNSIADEDSAEEIEVDFFGSVDDEGTGDGLELFYNNFFEPPSRLVQNRHVRSPRVRFHERVSVKKIKAVGKGMPVSSMNDEDSDEEEEEEEEET